MIFRSNPMNIRRSHAQPQLTPSVTGHDHIQGSPSAKVTLVEYGDYQCPECLQAYPIMLDIQEHMGDRMRLVFRNFPLTTIHPNAQHAAEAAEAAGAQGKFWEMHDYLFEHQSHLDDDDLTKYAQNIGLDSVRYERDLRDHSFAARVREDCQSGVRSGVNGTPTFFINGVRHDGPRNLEALLAAIFAEAGDR
jgi:protein-disulfide isomerase